MLGDRSSDDDADKVGGFSEAGGAHGFSEVGEVGGAGEVDGAGGSWEAGDVNFCCAGLKQHEFKNFSGFHQPPSIAPTSKNPSPPQHLQAI